MSAYLAPSCHDRIKQEFDQELSFANDIKYAIRCDHDYAAWEPSGPESEDEDDEQELLTHNYVPDRDEAPFACSVIKDAKEEVKGEMAMEAVVKEEREEEMAVESKVMEKTAMEAVVKGVEEKQEEDTAEVLEDNPSALADEVCCDHIDYRRILLLFEKI